MDKYISAKLDSFNFSKRQKELFVDIVRYVAAKVAAGSIDLSNFATKNDLNKLGNSLSQGIISANNTANQANNTAKNIESELPNIKENIKK